MNNMAATFGMVKGNGRMAECENIVKKVYEAFVEARRFYGRIAAWLNTQSMSAVIITAILTFFSFIAGATGVGSVSGIAFMLAIRPFITRPIESPIVKD